MTTLTAPPEQLVGARYILLEQVSWKAYEALAESWQDLPKRMTYDRGRLEIMSPLPAHERPKKLIGRIVETYTLEQSITCRAGGSLTFKLKEEQRGLEPDECYWIQNASNLRGSDEYDPEIEPPPDLAIEVDVTNSSLPRMSIYADLKVPEVWRYKDGVVTIHLLSPAGDYEPSDVGLALPALTAEVITRFVNLRDELADDTALMQAFLRWVREEAKESPKKPRRPRKK